MTEVPVFAKETIKNGTTGRIVYIPSGLPLSLCEIDGGDVGGLTWTTAPPSPSFPSRVGPIFGTSSASRHGWGLWPTSLSSTTITPRSFLSLADALSESAFQLFERFRYGISEIHVRVACV